MNSALPQNRFRHHQLAGLIEEPVIYVCSAALDETCAFKLETGGQQHVVAS